MEIAKKAHEFNGKKQYYSHLKIYDAYCKCLGCGVFHWVKQTAKPDRLQYYHCPKCRPKLITNEASDYNERNHTKAKRGSA